MFGLSSSVRTSSCSKALLRFTSRIRGPGSFARSSRNLRGAADPRTYCLRNQGVCIRSLSTRLISSSRSLVSCSATSVVQEVEMAKDKLAPPQPKYRKDYAPPPYKIDSVLLNFVLNEDVTLVESKMQLQPNYPGDQPVPLFLNGNPSIKLVSLKIGGQPVPEGTYSRTEKGLTIHALPAGSFELEIACHIKPQENTSLEGLYKSGGNFCTQCEAEGFRNITFFLDRPDVMAKYTTRVEAPNESYPVLLSNGNLTDSGRLGADRHYAVWEDPYPKPCYLFALVAGNLAVKKDKFRTASGRDVELRIYTAAKDTERVGFAMESLKKAMKWDEDVFGLEYDLDLFNIVAVDDFNMGAMENKSLNIFNSRLVLASAATATDGDFSRIEGVIGHEYFHNWTGNRVTCRDWFQLTLKEGLTVFRDQEFSADMNSRAVKRIEDVMVLRRAQFPEDSGTMAHPIRPDSYIKMDNFYTVTVYEKGAEVIRLYATLLGKQGFRKGMDLYFQRHDGSAVTCDDFLAAMADANGQDLSGVATWYGQAGTPNLVITLEHDPQAQTVCLKAKQSTPPTPGQPAKAPVLIPIAVGLLGPDGKDLPLQLQGSNKDLGPTVVLRLEKEEDTWTFTGIPTRPVPSLLRGFSAPVRMTVEGQSEADLVFLLANDSDDFNRWEAGQRLGRALLLRLYKAAQDSSKGPDTAARVRAAGGVDQGLIDAYRSVLTTPGLDGAFVSYAISLPAASELMDAIPLADPVVLHEVRMEVVRQLAAALRPQLEAAVAANDDAQGTPYVFSADASARRALKNKALSYLSALEDPAVSADILHRFRSAGNMTDEIGALAALAETPGKEREAALTEFYEKWKHEPLVVLKWLALMAGSNVPANLDVTKSLISHPGFTITNPNSCYSLFLAFARSPLNFHAADGSGYEFMADSILKVDSINRQVAARMVGVFTTWRQFDADRQSKIKAALKRIVETEGLSENVYEIASKSLVEE